MATLRGTYFYKGKREYKYEVNVYNAESYNPSDFTIQITNPEGKTTIASWNFRNRGIEQCVRECIESKIKK
ncbi:MAG TPA: hypothetical protein VJY62_10515 [Bacteroidia bacterium]|nr:hypothetical protein [Bacteroidia bacterium]